MPEHMCQKIYHTKYLLVLSKSLCLCLSHGVTRPPKWIRILCPQLGAIVTIYHPIVLRVERCFVDEKMCKIENTVREELEFL